MVRVATVAARAAAWGAAAAVVVASAPAAAMTPTRDRGCEDVTVVVEYNELGGDPLVACAGAGSAADAFDEAGVALEFLPQQPGFVCRVDGLPETGPCFDGDAYWSLWWSDSRTDWTYATLGVTALELHAGGRVAFAWHEGAGDAAPPDVDAGVSAGTGSPESDDGDGDVGAEEPLDDSSFPIWAAGGIAALVLGAAALPLLRRRRGEQS